MQQLHVRQVPDQIPHLVWRCNDGIVQLLEHSSPTFDGRLSGRAQYTQCFYDTTTVLGDLDTLSGKCGLGCRYRIQCVALAFSTPQCTIRACYFQKKMTTPGGSPVSCISLTKRAAMTCVSDDGLRISILPDTMVADSMSVSIVSRKFQGGDNQTDAAGTIPQGIATKRCSHRTPPGAGRSCRSGLAGVARARFGVITSFGKNAGLKRGGQE